MGFVCAGTTRRYHGAVPVASVRACLGHPGALGCRGRRSLHASLGRESKVWNRANGFIEPD